MLLYVEDLFVCSLQKMDGLLVCWLVLLSLMYYIVVVVSCGTCMPLVQCKLAGVCVS